MKVKWIGQAGLVFEHGGSRIIVDPYLSDECERLNPLSKRRVPVDEALFSADYDVVMLTHSHADHTDIPTLEKILGKEKNTLVLSSASAFEKVRTTGKNNNYVRFVPGCEWTFGDILFKSVYACHSDPDAVGFIIECEGKKYYITGDTLYNENIFTSLPQNIYAVFLPINGKGNNMNATDAARFAKKCGAKYAVPLHFGMFDDLCGEIFKAENRVIPKLYEYIDLEDGEK